MACGMLFAVAILFSATNVVFTFTLNSSRSEKNITFGIIGGEETTIEKRPYQAHLKPQGCGAVIIAPTWILSARHCGGGVKCVVVGSTEFSKGREYQVAAEHKNPNADVLLLKLKVPLEFSDKVQPVKLASEADIKPGQNAVVSGWGTTDTNYHGMKQILREVTVKTVSDEDCKKAYQGEFDEKFEICAADKGKDSCQGDSGGPLVTADETKLIGIVSWGRGCAEPGYPGVYAKVPSVLDWIKKTTDDASL